MTRKKLATIGWLIALPLGIGAFVLQGQNRGTDGPRLFAQVLRYVEQYAVDSLSDAEVYEKAARGLVKNLNDPYADLYSPEQLANFQRNQLGNNYGGLGMQIQSQDGLITVTQVFPGTPGERGGIQPGDRIMVVDSVPVSGMRVEEVSSRLIGPPGTKVSVAFAREGVSEPIKGIFTRAIIQVPAVPYTLILEGGVGYLPLQRFNESAASQVDKAVRQLRSRGARSLVFDLRGNPGGSLDQALGIVNLFLTPDVEIASVRHRGRQPEIFRTDRESIIDSTAMVVLIDNGSASASEIVAGALQDHDRALVVGTSSFGKGLVQTLYPLDGSWAIKLTTGKWYTPSGRSIQGEHKQLEDGRFVEFAPDSAETDSSKRARPVFHSTSGRIVYGGGGITPDVLIRADTLSDLEQEFLRVLGPKWPTFYNTVFGYARELKGRVAPDFEVSPAWRDAVYQRLGGTDVAVERATYDAAEPFVSQFIEQQVASLAFGDSLKFRRGILRDRQLQTALDYLRRGRTQRELLALAAAPPPSSKPN